MRDAYFVSELLWISGKTLKKKRSAASLAEPLLKAHDEKYQEEQRMKRYEDEEYLKKTFNKGGVEL